VLITGGAGFLGYHLAGDLDRRGMAVALADVAPFQESEYPPGSRFFRADVRDRNRLIEILREFPAAAIVHAAAALPLWRKKDIFEVNVGGTRNVLDAALATGVRRVVYISSTAVYGVPRKHPVFEDDPLVGVGPYGKSKIMAERVCAEFRRCGLCVPIVRPKTFVGTGRLGVFQILFDWVESGCRIPMIGPGRNRYQLLEVEDLCDAIYRCATADERLANDTFNVGAREFGTVRDDLTRLCEHAGGGARPIGTPAWLVKPALRIFEMLRLSPLYRWVYGTADKDSFVSTDKIEARLGWQPRFSNSQALIRSYQWYREHQTEADLATGVTHRVAWRQGVLRVFKWLLHSRSR
jgi:nucleoside-diphosphate-sugar epimerase